MTGRQPLAMPACLPERNSPLGLEPFAWGRNQRTGEPVDIRLKGRRWPADVQAFTDEAGVTGRYAVWHATTTSSVLPVMRQRRYDGKQSVRKILLSSLT